MKQKYKTKKQQIEKTRRHSARILGTGAKIEHVCKYIQM